MRLFSTMNILRCRTYLLAITFLVATNRLEKIQGEAVPQENDLPVRGLCAHRGAMDTHPENTLASFKAAIDHGAHMIEFDVHLTSDHKLVIIHDPTVERTTNGHGKVSEMTLEQIKKLDAGSWKGAEFAGEKIPTLSEALSIMPSNIWLNIHLKEAKGLGKMVAQEILKHKRAHQAFLACSQALAKEAKSVHPDIMVCNMDRQSSNWEYVNLTVDSGADFIQLKGDISEEYRALTKHLRAKGIRINYFGTDDQNEIRSLFQYGVEFPLVNNIAKSIEYCSSVGIQPWRPSYH